MKKYDLLRSGDSIIQVLEVQADRVLVIDCIKRTMPVWVDVAELESYSECTSGVLSQVIGVIPSEVGSGFYVFNLSSVSEFNKKTKVQGKS